MAAVGTATGSVVAIKNVLWEVVKIGTCLIAIIRLSLLVVGLSR